MGFSVTASHVILLVTILAGASVLGAAYSSYASNTDAGERTASRLREDQVHTGLSVVRDGTYPLYNAGAKTFTVRLLDNGTTVLKVSRMAYMIAGTAASASSYDVDGSTTTDYWMPGQRLTVVFASVASSPSRFAAFAENGVGAYWSP